MALGDAAKVAAVEHCAAALAAVAHNDRAWLAAVGAMSLRDLAAGDRRRRCRTCRRGGQVRRDGGARPSGIMALLEQTAG